MGTRSFGRRRKKKDLKSPERTLFRSIFAPSPHQLESPTRQFQPPEIFGSFDPAEVAFDAGASAWDVAIRYHELKAQTPASQAQKLRALRRLSAEAILRKAQEVLGSVSHPTDPRVSILGEVPWNAEQVDFDLEETLENAPHAFFEKSVLSESDLWASYRVHRRQSMILAVDTSLSMTGEKLALTAVALAVVLLQFPDDPVGIIAFENAASVLKKPEEKISIGELVERFLDVPAQGYTHLEDGMKEALRLARASSNVSGGGPPSTVLLTDGKYTAGRDPAYLAPRFSQLVVLKMGKEKASLSLCRELAQKGGGSLREVGELESLPVVMYGVVKDILRGGNGF